MTRNEQAQREIGVTEISPRLARVMTAAFLLVIVTVPAWQTLYAFRSRTLPSVSSLFPFPTGSELKSFEMDLENGAVIRDRLLPPTQRLLSRWLGAGNERVYLGRKGNLFLKESIDYVAGPPFLDANVIARKQRDRKHWSADPTVAVSWMAKELAKQGIRLIVVPTPVKPVIQPARFTRRYADRTAPLHNPSYGAFTRQTGDALLLEPLSDADSGARLFLKSDTHWTPEGVDRAAQRLARFIEAKPLGLAPREEGRYARSERSVTNTGDLARMLALEPPPLENVTIRPVRQLDGSPWQPDGDAQILLLGDSFSNIYSGSDLKWGEHAGLAEQLSYHLQRPVDVIVQNDNGAFATREQLAKDIRGGKPLAGKKIVIYQFAERELAHGNWRAFNLSPDPTSAEIPAPDGAAISVEGVVQAVTAVPEPGTVPYRDALATLHLKDMNPPLPDGTTECVVVTWGLRDNKWTAAARLRVGRRINAVLVPWEYAPRGVDRIVRLQLPDPEFALIDLPVYWTAFGH